MMQSAIKHDYTPEQIERALDRVLRMVETEHSRGQLIQANNNLLSCLKESETYIQMLAGLIPFVIDPTTTHVEVAARSVYAGIQVGMLLHEQLILDQYEES